jgi:hypothetical protein
MRERALSVNEASAMLSVSPRSLSDRRWRLRVVLVGHRAREDLHVGGVSRRKAVGGWLGNCHELRALPVDIDFKMAPKVEARTRSASVALRTLRLTTWLHLRRRISRAVLGYRFAVTPRCRTSTKLASRSL